MKEMAAAVAPPGSPVPQASPDDKEKERKPLKEIATEQFFNAHKFDDTLPLKLDIIDERKTSHKKTSEYVVRVRAGPFADTIYEDFTVTITSAQLQQLIADLKAVGYSPTDCRRNGRHNSSSPSPVPSVTSENSVLGSGASVASDLDQVGVTAPLTSPVSSNGWTARGKYWQEFLHSLCTSLMASTNPSLRYLLFPNLNLTDWHRLAMQHATMVFSSEGIWEIEERLPGIGWRFAKHYAIVREVENHDSKLMMSWTFPGRKYSHCEVKERQEALKQLLKLRHPFVYPIIYETFHEAGCLVMHPVCPAGSLKDRIYNAKPTKQFHKKYSRCHERRPFSIDEVRLYGRQILEALNVLHEAGIPYGNLHARNVMIDKGICRLTDLHNTLIGLPGYYRPYLIQLPKICMFPSIDVYCFGRILYEMTFGEGLDAPCIENIPPECPPEIQPVLNLLITTEACFNKGMPTIRFLLSVPLFQGVDIGIECPPIRLSSKVIGTCRDLAQKNEKKLSEAEKAFNHSQSSSEGVFFRPISPVLGRVKKSSSMQLIKNFFIPSSRRNSKTGCFSSLKSGSQYEARCPDVDSASDADDVSLSLPMQQIIRDRSKSLDSTAPAAVPSV